MEGVTIITIFSIFGMFMIDYLIQPGYMIKSILKIILFLFIPLVFIWTDKSISIKEYFKISSRKQFLISLGLGLGVYVIILATYYILKPFIKLDNI